MTASIENIQDLFIASPPLRFGLSDGQMKTALTCYDIAYSTEYGSSVSNSIELYGEALMSNVLQNITYLDNTFGFGLAGIAWSICLLTSRG